MIEPSDSRRPPISPAMAMRVAVLGGVAFALFAVIFFRLWYLQVLTGDQYLAEANNNRVRVEVDPAPRGSIVDRNQQTLVDNRRANVVALRPESLPDEILSDAAEYGQRAGRREARPRGRKGPPEPLPPLADPLLRIRYDRLGEVIKLSATEIHRRVISELVQAPYAAIRLKTDVADPVRDYLAERNEDFPGVDADARFVRAYPHKQLAAQLFGPIGEISPDELEEERYSGVSQGTVVGKDGLERAYDQYLRGTDGTTRVTVGADNRPRSTRAGREPRAGRQLQVSIDLGLQQTLQKSLTRIAGGLPGAAVALDPRSGEVLAMASLPTFDPRLLSRPLTPERSEQLFGDEGGAPLVNRAVTGQYSTGSTFKPITALAALESGQTTPGRIINDNACLRIGTAEGDEVCNAGKSVFGPVNLQRALTVSSNVYFYQMGLDLNPAANQPLQRWAERLGIGRTTGIDLPSDVKGNVPSAAWREALNKRETACRKRRDIEIAVGTFSSCGISDLRSWTAGDEVNLAVGQGDLQTTPLQLAVAYSTLANGGTVVRPHLGIRVQDDQGRTLQRLDPGAQRKVDIDPANREVILAGLRGAASDPEGTSSSVFEGWDHAKRPVYGKTGTAQLTQDGQEVEQSWYATYAHELRANGKPAREIVIVATIEKGGFGAARAAPVACETLWKWFTGKAKSCQAGTNTTR